MLENLQKELIEMKSSYDERKQNLKMEYNKFKDTKKYSVEFINKKTEEEKVKIQEINKSMKVVIDDKVNRLISTMEKAEDITPTLEYQTRLSNTLKLMELVDGNIASENLDFIVKAYDSNTLEILRKAYKNNSVINKAYENSNKILLAEKMRELGRKYDESFSFGFKFHSIRKDI